MTATWQFALTDYERADTSLIASRALQQRAESKFVVPEETAVVLTAALQGEFAVLGAGDALVASYRSLYFDTEDLALFHAHRCGRRVRHKVRIRQYIDRLLGVFEIKTRRGEHDAAKVRRPRPFERQDLESTEQELARDHCALAGRLQPEAWVAYQRLTLVGLRTFERVTIDTELDVWWAESRQRLRGAAVVEVKQARLSYRSTVMQALRAAGARPGWMSKYCTAIALTRPGVRVGRLARRLHELEAVGSWTC